MELHDYEESGQGTSWLLNWPKALTRFLFSSFYGNQNYMDLPMFASMLQKHKETLIDLSIGYLSPAGVGKLFDLSEFTALEKLQLSRWQLGNGWSRNPRTMEFATELLAPNLKSFTLDFSINDQHPEEWSAFGEMEENWIRTFAETAIAVNSPLREISIIFTPDDYGVTKADGYPWDRMKVLQEELKPSGILLSYNKPTLSREEWCTLD